MALAGTGGQGWTSSMGRGLGMGGAVWRWCEYKGVNEREHTAPVHHCHTPHTPSGTIGGGVHTRDPKQGLNKVSHWGRAQDEEEAPPHTPNLTDASSEE